MGYLFTGSVLRLSLQSKNENMKKIILMLAITGSLIACDNAGTSTDNKKDSIDSAADAKKDAIDSAAGDKKDAIDSAANAKKDAVDSKDSANRK
jgi:hypothetical protein